MQGILNIRMLSVRAALLAVLAAGLVLPSAQAQSAKQNQKSDKQGSSSSQAQAPSAGSKAAEEESAPANKEHAGGPREGIKIHGHWVIDVRNPDGTLVMHREFENAYSQTEFLADILARQNSVGLWEVILLGSSTNYYLLTEPGDPSQSQGSVFVFQNLKPSAQGLSFVLSGAFTAPASDAIISVETKVWVCSAATPPATPCASSLLDPFTRTTLSGASFAAGQIVQVTVTITAS